LRNWNVTSVGNVPYSITQDDKNSGSYSLRMGPSSCPSDCFSSYQVILTLKTSFPQPGLYRISYYLREPNDWGGNLRVIVNDEVISIDSGKYSNQHKDSGWYKYSITYSGSINSLVLMESDLTNDETVYLDDILVTWETLPVTTS
jgi:hypothetical protein